jgi:hypothetical protein
MPEHRDPETPSSQQDVDEQDHYAPLHQTFEMLPPQELLAYLEVNGIAFHSLSYKADGTTRVYLQDREHRQQSMNLIEARSGPGSCRFDDADSAIMTIDMRSSAPA